MKKRIVSFIMCLALVFTLGGSLWLSLGVSSSAAEVTYSNVLDDLKKDSSFNEADYPSVPGDYSLKVIQIAESESGELFLYVYQPASPDKVLLASSVVISTGIENDDVDYIEYSLSLLSVDGVFQKYKVNDFSVKSEKNRYYLITQLFRPFDKNIDDEPTDDNTIDYMSYGVGHLWTVMDFEDNTVYKCEYADVIKVENAHVGFIRYEGGIFQFEESVDSHYVAFVTDRPIDKLLEVDITYKVKKVVIEPSSLGITTVTSETDLGTTKDTLYAEEILEGNTTGFFPQSYEYNRIQSIETFLENEGDDLRECTSEDIKNMKWVLRFYESAYVDTLQGFTSDSGFINYTGKHEYQIVSEVGFLRMKYEYEGDTYNLGVVANKQSGDLNPDNDTGDLDIDLSALNRIGDTLTMVVSIVVIALICYVLKSFVIPFVKLIFAGVKFIITDILLPVIELPFVCIGWILGWLFGK